MSYEKISRTWSVWLVVVDVKFVWNSPNTACFSGIHINVHNSVSTLPSPKITIEESVRCRGPPKTKQDIISEKNLPNEILVKRTRYFLSHDQTPFDSITDFWDYFLENETRPSPSLKEAASRKIRPPIIYHRKELPGNLTGQGTKWLKKIWSSQDPVLKKGKM